MREESEAGLRRPPPGLLQSPYVVMDVFHVQNGAEALSNFHQAHDTADGNGRILYGSLVKQVCLDAEVWKNTTLRHTFSDFSWCTHPVVMRVSQMLC